MAMLGQPTDRVFWQSFVGYRMNSGWVSPDTAFLDSLREQNYFMADVALGAWAYRNPGARGITTVAPTLELHYTGTFALEKTAPGRSTHVNAIYGQTDILNLTAGVTTTFGDRWSLTTAFAVPLRDNAATIGAVTPITIGTDRRYDWAFLLNLNYRFGR